MLFVARTVRAQAVSYFGDVQSQGIIVIDEFEYWDSPKNHNWNAIEPAYPTGFPVWGMNIGPGQMATVLDFQEGSRVLEVFYPANVYVPNFQKYAIQLNNLVTSIVGPAPDAAALAAYAAYSVLNMKFRAPVSIEALDSYEIVVGVLTTDGTNLIPMNVRLTPRAVNAVNPVAVPEETASYDSELNEVDVSIGRESEDGSWHMINVDMAQAVGIATGLGFVGIDSITIEGNEYRCDDIQLMTAAAAMRVGLAPYLFHINHVFTQIFDPAGYSRFIFASDCIADGILPHQHTEPTEHGCHGEMAYGTTCDLAKSLTPCTQEGLCCIDASALAYVNAQFWVETAAPHLANVYGLAIDPSYAPTNETELATAISNYMTAVADLINDIATAQGIAPEDVDLGEIRRNAIQAAAQGIAPPALALAVGVAGADVTVDARYIFPLDRCMLLDETMAQGPVTNDGGSNMIGFSASVGGAHELGTCTDLLQQVPLGPTVGCEQTSVIPPYYPLYAKRSGARGIVENEPYLTATELETVAEALYYGGYNAWPTVALLNIPSQQTLENIVITVVASNGLSEDVESFMLETVNYPVTNHPPVIEDVDDQIFYIGQGEQEYQLNATDADSFTFSSAVQFANDIENLTFTAYLDGYPSYSYGPYTNALIDQKSGLIKFEPMFEGAYEMLVTVRDPKGAEAYASFVVYCVNPNTWLNHPPVMLGDWDHPMIGVQGQELKLDFSGIVDPDGEPLYFSCNIGAIGYVGGEPTWSFKTNFPGTYMVEIVAYDTSGGYLVIPQEVIITTW
jgi:hypothetical protein